MNEHVALEEPLCFTAGVCGRFMFPFDSSLMEYLDIDNLTHNVKTPSSFYQPLACVYE